MTSVPIPGSGHSVQLRSLPSGTSAVQPKQDWTHLVAAGTVVAGGALMVIGHKRAGLAVAAAGTALALLEEPEVIDRWWKSLPAYLAEAQGFLNKVEGYLEQVSVQGHRIQSILRR